MVQIFNRCDVVLHCLWVTERRMDFYKSGNHENVILLFEGAHNLNQSLKHAFIFHVLKLLPIWLGPYTKNAIIDQVISFWWSNDCIFADVEFEQAFHINLYHLCGAMLFNSSTPGQNGRHSHRWHFQMHFLEWKCLNFDENFTEICSLGIDNIPALVQIMAWRRPGDKPLSEPKLTRFAEAYMRH